MTFSVKSIFSAIGARLLAFAVLVDWNTIVHDPKKIGAVLLLALASFVKGSSDVASAKASGSVPTP